MRGISTREVALLAGELGSLAGYYIDKFYDMGDGRFRMRLSRKGESMNLLCILCHTINRTSYVEKADAPSNFCMAVRKRVEGAVIRRVYQMDDDRIIVFSIERSGSPYNLIFEMFGKGNLVITDASMRISLAYMPHTFKDRAVQVNAEYTAPRRNAAPVREPSVQGSYAVNVYVKEGAAVDYSVGEDDRYEDLERKEFGSLQEALDFVYAQQGDEGPRESPEVRALEASVERQGELIRSSREEAERCRLSGKLLFDNMHEVNQLISKAAAVRRITREGLQALFPAIKIKDINLKEKTLTIELN